jgi:DNA-binding transcriptional regulator LsrR (DeoR family)
MARIDELRQMAKVATMYYSQGLTQQEITKKLHIHQSTVSRLLRRAQDTNIVRITVTLPSGIFSELEQKIETTFDLTEAVVVDSSTDERTIARDLGGAAAFFLESTLNPGDIIGISSWSEALLAMVDSLHPGQCAANGKVVQILGGLGNPGAESHATRLTQRLAELTSASAVLLPAPGIVGSTEHRKVLLKDPYVQQATALFSRINVALVGIGALEPSKLLASSGNTFPPKELNLLKRQGAVGDICLRFFDEQGVPVSSAMNKRVIAIELADLRRARRVVGVAGGPRKHRAILAALRGRWVNVLITDKSTAEFLAGA